jgi:type II secretory pathway pseudopilin PulG
LVELRVLGVIVFLGIGAAILLPTFFGQRDKAGDAAAKATAQRAQQAAESYYMDSGSYSGMTADALRRIEPSLSDSLTVGVGAGGSSYALTVPSGSGNRWTVDRNEPTGSVTRTCRSRGRGSCPLTGTW